jgi:hypothetical protein
MDGVSLKTARDMMEDTMNPSLQQSEVGFHRIGRDVAPYKLGFVIFDDFMTTLKVVSDFSRRSPFLNFRAVRSQLTREELLRNFGFSGWVYRKCAEGHFR